MTLSSLIEQFHACTLPRQEWTHHAHLGVALWTMRHFEFEEAVERLREEIRAYNESVGVENGPFSGYHETITQFFAQAVRQFLEQHADEDDLDKLWGELIREWGDKNLVMRYYSRRYLFSPGTRARWAEPDLKPLGFGA